VGVGTLSWLVGGVYKGSIFSFLKEHTFFAQKSFRAQVDLRSKVCPAGNFSRMCLTEGTVLWGCPAQLVRLPCSTKSGFTACKVERANRR